MGCTVSKEAALHELKKTISQLTDENQQLQIDLDKLISLKNSDESGNKPPTVQHIKSLFTVYECNLKSLNKIGKDLLESSKQNLLPSANVTEVLEYSETLTKKLVKLDTMIKERNRLKIEEEDLELQISVLENSINDLEHQYFSNEESRNEHHMLHEIVSELHMKKEEALQEIEVYKQELEKLTQDIKNSGLDDKNSQNDLSNYEVLMRMSDLEVNIELKKIDGELDVLANEMKDLKLRENELQRMEALINSRSGSRTENREFVPFHVKKSKERADMLEVEHSKLRDQPRLVRMNTLVKMEQRLDLFKQFAEKQQGNEGDGKGVYEKIEMRMQASLNRVLARGLKN